MTDLPIWDDATRDQIMAARPNVSTWLSANAGSGKTRVLTDRVARLLLDDVNPQQILCLTYTKAAASEMQNRLFKRLGTWAMMDDDKLTEELRNLGVVDPKLDQARTLFAQAIETPGGLKIQTIHSFCASLLRRFPLEAQVNPQFKEIEDRAAELLRADIVDAMADGDDAGLIADLARNYTSDDLAGFTKSIVSHRATFELPFNRADVLGVLGQPADLTKSKIEGAVFDGSELQLIHTIIPALLAKGGNDEKAGKVLQTLTTIDFSALPILESVFVHKPKTKNALEPKIGAFPTKPTQKIIANDLPALNDLMQRVADNREARLALLTVDRSEALHHFAHRFSTLYEAAKQQRGWLDFDDLINKARALLNDPSVAAWVLYRIDGGIDHILVDEAQDTSPAQWDVIEKLADEFSSGEGVRGNQERTLFVVGDKKQSIYSFQGADPREFDLKRDMFQAKFQGAGLPFEDHSLDYSFRSSSAVLGTVDRTFDPVTNPFSAEQTAHKAFKDALPGRVDVWPAVEPIKDETEQHWSTPLDRRSPQHHSVILAERIAHHIKTLVENEHYIPDDNKEGMFKRRITAGDFLILVQRRSDLFSEIIRACKAAGLAIAGADRLKVGAELAVRDIAALLSFLATPDDNLGLATALRSPLFGWSEQDIFTLAHYRTKEGLWQSLRTQLEKYPNTVSILRDLRAQVDYLRPFDLIERILIHHDGRRNLLARLGKEAEDGIDALLDQALAYERNDVPSLTGFLGWMETDDLTIKRQIDSASDQIRVMTVHGAKGLEAPIVILPDTIKRERGISDDIITLNGLPIWRPNEDIRSQVVTDKLEELKERQREERMRLLYVAMTRAEKWLIVAGAGDPKKDKANWHEMTEVAVGQLGAVPFDEMGIEGLRHQAHDWDGLPILDIPRIVDKAAVLEPFYDQPVVNPPLRSGSLSPSNLGGAKALPGEQGWDEETAKSYGTLVHHLLEHLPSFDPEDRAEAGQRLAQSADPALGASAIGECLRLLDTAQIAHLFAPTALAEVAVTAKVGPKRLYGIIDRLIVSDTTVLAVDFKTNRHIPPNGTECPEGLLRQMGAYAHALTAIYPDHKIETAILWTRSGELMALDHDIVTNALWRSQHLDATTAAT